MSDVSGRDDQGTNRRRTPFARLTPLIVFCAVLFFAGVSIVYVGGMGRIGWDITSDLQPWFHHYVVRGIAKGLATDPSNYTPFYNYLLALVAPFSVWINEVTLIKLISTAFIPISALITFQIVRCFQSKAISLMAAFGIFALPTVVFNAPFWGQADIIYTTFLLGCVLFVLRNKPGLAVAFFGLALSIKLQAMFLSPFILYLVLSKRIRWYQLFIVPMVYVATILPEGLLGRPWGELFSIYLQQAGTFHELSMGAPNPYQLIEKWNLLSYDTGVKIGLVVAILSGVLLAWLPLKARHRGPVFDVELITLTLMIMPFVLPKMHDRYFFPADVFSFVLFAINWRYWPLALGMQLASGMAYGRYLFDWEGSTEGAVVMILVVGLYLAHMIGMTAKIRS